MKRTPNRKPRAPKRVRRTLVLDAATYDQIATEAERLGTSFAKLAGAIVTAHAQTILKGKETA